MKSRLKAALLGWPGFQAACRAMTAKHVRAIMYHGFAATDADGAIGQDTLRRQLELVVRHHTSTTPDGHLAALAGNVDGPCPVVLTVDDGYANFYQIAFPLLRELNLPAMLFVTTGFVSGKTWFWWDKLNHLFSSAPATEISAQLGPKEVTLDLATEVSKKQAWHVVADHCRFLPDVEKEALIADLASKLGRPVPEQPPAAMESITWDQAREMAAGGIDFGAHTVNHPILSRVDPATARTEIVASQKQLASELGMDIRWFCYPQGGPADVTPEIQSIVAAHFDGSYLAYQEMDKPNDPTALPRYLAAVDMTEFCWMLCGAEYLFLRLKKTLGRSTGVGAEYWHGSESPE